MGTDTEVSHVQLAPLLVTAAHPPPMTLPVSSQLVGLQQLHEPRQLSPMGVPKAHVHMALPAVGHPAPQIAPVSVHTDSVTPGALGGETGEGVTSGGGDGLGGGGDGGGDGGSVGGDGGGGQQPQVLRQLLATNELDSGSHVHPSTLVRTAQPPPMM